MIKAEDLAKKLYPDWKMTGVSAVDGQEKSMVRIQRAAYIEGYHQAEEDLALTIEDIRKLNFILAEVDVEIKFNMIDIETETLGYYQEVLNRFNKQKGENI